MTNIQHTIIGLPSSGKTTFLAALWHQLNSEEVDTELALDKLLGDHTHLNSVVGAWMRCEKVPRTSTAAEETVAIHLRERTTNRRTTVLFPDLSGETFTRQVAMRTCSPSYVHGFDGDGGILLFVTADRIQDDLTILDLAPMLEGDPSSSEPATELQDFLADQIPGQVRLVELLQFLEHPPFRRTPRRIALIVSAWDLVAPPELTPEEWLERSLPLLHQFLKSNRSSFDVRFYGVSAQGGQLEGEERERLLAETPGERVLCLGPEIRPHDLTGPIAWLMRYP